MSKLPREENGIYNFYGRIGTWIEGSVYIYPGGGYQRRARATFPDGKRRIVRCANTDTYYILLARHSSGTGFLTVEGGEVKYTYNEREANNE